MATTLAFDIGGTSFRSARYIDGQLASEIRRVPAISRPQHPDRSLEFLQTSLVAYLGEEAYRLEPTGGVRVSVSLGAAMNAHSGQVLNASTLWGDVFEPFPLREELERKHPKYDWIVHNDLTCAVVSAAHRYARSPSRVALYTVSTGIGCRTLVLGQRRRIPLHPRLGIQGEVGHFVVSPILDGALGDFVCDCGAVNHLNAMCSGRGIERVLERIVRARSYSADEHPIGPVSPGEPAIAGLRRRLAEGRPAASEILAAVVAPLAKIIAEHLCFDPELEKVFVVGGTLVALEPFYREALLQALLATPTYLTSEYDPDYFGRVMQFCVSGEVSSLDGAALLASEDDLFDAV